MKLLVVYIICLRFLDIEKLNFDETMRYLRFICGETGFPPIPIILAPIIAPIGMTIIGMALIPPIPEEADFIAAVAAMG